MVGGRFFPRRALNPEGLSSPVCVVRALGSRYPSVGTPARGSAALMGRGPGFVLPAAGLQLPL